MITKDPSGALTVVGVTGSSDFPTTPGAYDTSYSGGPNDAFVTRLNASGSMLIYSTFLGGSGDEWAYSLALDISGAATVVGGTTSPDFPTTPGAYDTTFNGGTTYGDAFVTRLNSAGSSLLWSTFLGGSSDDWAEDLALQSSGEVTLSGATSSRNFPTTPAAFDTSYNGAGPYGIGDGFVARLNSTGSTLVYSTFLGGTGFESAYGVALDNQGVGTVGGATMSSNFPVTPGAYDTTYNGGYDVFISRLDFIPVGIEEDYWPQPKPSLSLYLSAPLPNPTSGSISYSINLARKTHARVRIFDASGRLVQTLVDKRLPAGLSSFTWNPDKSKIPNGTYILRVDAEGMSQTRKFVLVK